MKVRFDAGLQPTSLLQFLFNSNLWSRGLWHGLLSYYGSRPWRKAQVLAHDFSAIHGVAGQQLGEHPPNLNGQGVFKWKFVERQHLVLRSNLHWEEWDSTKCGGFGIGGHAIAAAAIIASGLFGWGCQQNGVLFGCVMGFVLILECAFKTVI